MKKDNRLHNFLPEKFAFGAAIFLLVFFALSATISARTLAKYRGAVREAKLATQSLLAPDVEDESFGDYQKRTRATLAQIRRDIPVSERIEWQNQTFETNNQWLADRLDKFEKEPANSPKREAFLNEISERLDALEASLDELENSVAATRSKDEDKQKLAEILRREEYQKPEAAEESLFYKIYRRIMEWLDGIFPKPNIPEPNPDNNFQSLSFVLQMLLYAVILGIIGFFIYRLAPFFLERSRRFEKSERKERVILGERLSANETSANLYDEAENLARSGDLRGAIRKGYIALLFELSERKIIALQQNKTNRDYLRDVRKKENLYENMRGLTRNYERHWYGFSEAAPRDWEEFRRDYQKTVNS